MYTFSFWWRDGKRDLGIQAPILNCSTEVPHALVLRGQFSLWEVYTVVHNCGCCLLRHGGKDGSRMKWTPADGYWFSEEETESTLKDSGNGHGSQIPTHDRTPASDVALLVPSLLKTIFLASNIKSLGPNALIPFCYLPNLSKNS